MLLAKREVLQQKIDAWHLANKGQKFDQDAYKTFLKEIGYLQSEPEDFAVSTEHVDAEIAHIAGPQLVVPVMNARYALNAANARWGSLYDALYGTDVISEAADAGKGRSYNPVRGAKVMEYAAKFLDQTAPLVQGSYAQVTAYRVQIHNGQATLQITLQDGNVTQLQHTEQFVGFCGEANAPTGILLCNNQLHFEIC